MLRKRPGTHFPPLILSDYSFDLGIHTGVSLHVLSPGASQEAPNLVVQEGHIIRVDP